MTTENRVTEPETLLAVTMTPQAAESFLAALTYGNAVLRTQAEANEASATSAAMKERADWLLWGAGRVRAAEEAVDPLAERVKELDRRIAKLQLQRDAMQKSAQIQEAEVGRLRSQLTQAQTALGRYDDAQASAATTGTDAVREHIEASNGRVLAKLLREALEGGK